MTLYQFFLFSRLSVATVRSFRRNGVRSSYIYQSCFDFAPIRGFTMNRLRRRFRDFQHVRYFNLCRVHNRRLGGWSRFITLKNKRHMRLFRDEVKRLNMKERAKSRTTHFRRLRSKFRKNAQTPFYKKSL